MEAGLLTADDIICYVPVYNDADALGRCLKRLDILGIRGLVVDGRFTDFPQINRHDYSTDKTKEVAESYNAIFEYKSPGREQDKLNFAFDIARKHGYEVFMYCGADAFFEGDMSEFLLDLQRLYDRHVTLPTLINMQAKELQPDSKWNNTGSRQPRIILNYWKIEARHLHWTLYEKGAPDITPLNPIGTIIGGLILYHDNSVRPKERDNLMTEYQNGNVPRERALFMRHIVPKTHKKIKIMQWTLDVDGTYEQARASFLSKYTEYSHLMLIRKGYHVNDAQLEQFENVLMERNNVIMNLSIITAVWHSEEDEDYYTLNPTGEIEVDFPKYPRIQQLYSPKGVAPSQFPIIVVPHTPGPVWVMDAKALRLMDHIGDDLDFAAISSQLGLQIHADTRIKF